MDNKLVSWVGRHIAKDSALPYKELSKEESIIPPKEFLFNYDNAYDSGGKYLILTEGIFDAISIDRYLGKIGRAVCLFTKRLKSETQLISILNLSRKFERIAVLLDQDAQREAVALAQELVVLGMPVYKLDLVGGVKDPGDMKKHHVQELVQHLTYL